jgi:glycosyltransferase involved in cell wall biosynthesis
LKKICLLSDLHLSANPRVWKEGNTLASHGYKVVILTMWTSDSAREKDQLFVAHPNLQYKASLNLIVGEVNPVIRFLIRAQARLRREIKKKFNIDSAGCLGYAPKTMIKAAVKEQADLYIAHTEFGLVIGKELINLGRKVAFDIEDWYSNDYLVPERPVALLKSLEYFALNKGLYCSCPSQSMATALGLAYSAKGKLEVIYNGFSIKENPVMIQSQNATASLVWFSQTIGPGRGLETLIESLQYLEQKVILHLYGNCVEGYEVYLQQIFPQHAGHTLFIHPPVKHSELVSILAQYKIGLAIENNHPENKNTTVSNKILQYVQAGIKILATNTAGQSEIAAYFPDAIALISPNEPRQWSITLENLIKSPAINASSQAAAFEKYFSWEAQEKKLLKLVENAINA